MTRTNSQAYRGPHRVVLRHALRLFFYQKPSKELNTAHRSTYMLFSFILSFVSLLSLFLFLVFVLMDGTHGHPISSVREMEAGRPAPMMERLCMTFVTSLSFLSPHLSQTCSLADGKLAKIDKINVRKVLLSLCQQKPLCENKVTSTYT